MSKLAAAKLVGFPVPDPVPDDVTALVVYYGPVGFVPDYAQAERIEVPLAGVEIREKDGVSYYVFDSARLPPTDGTYEMRYTLADPADQEEGDFSPPVAVPLDRIPPPAGGQPVLLN